MLVFYYLKNLASFRFQVKKYNNNNNTNNIDMYVVKNNYNSIFFRMVRVTSVRDFLLRSSSFTFELYKFTKVTNFIFH